MNAEVSVVIPSRNRLESLNRTLVSIMRQVKRPAEVIVVDSSDTEIHNSQLKLPGCILIRSTPSVCLQRNIGIERCHSRFILLCDDDIELDENYIGELESALKSGPDTRIASGILLEKVDGNWSHCPSNPSTPGLLYAYIFKLSVWTDLSSVGNKLTLTGRKILANGNHIAKSGWPVVVNYHRPSFTTPIYGLGAAMFHAEDLKKSGFDKAFFANGIGDNYDLALSIGSDVFVTWSASAKHHKEAANRIDAARSYYYRAGALHYIMMKYPRFSAQNRIWLWISVFGNGLLFLFRLELKKLAYNCKLLLLIMLGKSIYKRSR